MFVNLKLQQIKEQRFLPNLKTEKLEQVYQAEETV